MIDDESAKLRWHRSPTMTTASRTRRLYTAWDNMGDEGRFFRGVDTLGAPRHPADPSAGLYAGRLRQARDVGTAFLSVQPNGRAANRPYPMVYGDAIADPSARRLVTSGSGIARFGEFQRWVIRKAYTFIPFEHYDVNAKGRGTVDQLELLAADNITTTTGD
jgi:hypothetical protein